MPLLRDIDGTGPNQIDLAYARGDSKAIPFTRVNKDGNRVNITGRTYILTVDSRADPDDASTKQFDSTGSITDAANGELEFPITALSSGALSAPQTYYFDIAETIGSNAETVAKGPFRVKMDVGK